MTIQQRFDDALDVFAREIISAMTDEEDKKFGLAIKTYTVKITIKEHFPTRIFLVKGKVETCTEPEKEVFPTAQGVP